MQLQSLLDLFHHQYPGLITPANGHTDLSCEVDHLTHDSRRVRPGSLFVALIGANQNGNHFIPHACQLGASAILTATPETVPFQIPVLTTQEPRKAMALLAKTLYGQPDRHLKVLGVTGTNGKTTTTYLLQQLLGHRHRCGRLGTIGYFNGHSEERSTMTTPESSDLYLRLREMVDYHCGYAAMEISSHGIAQHRVEGLELEAAFLTSFSQDHLDFHRTMDAYWACKSQLFSHLTPAGVAILNGDEPRCHSLSLTNQTIFFGQGNHNHLSFALVSSGLTGMSLKFFEHQKEVLACQVPLLGVHNAYNLTAALAYLRHAGESWNDIAPRLPLIKSVPGRMELLRLKQPFGVIIDFAHTPDSVHQVCASCRAWVQGQLIVILGAGGNRDVDKRPLMGRAACENADLVWFTSDNPRNEDPMDIIDGLMSGSIPGPEIRIEPDRREAIAQALQRAKPQDLILILGKGHERTQTIGTQVIPFHDGEVVTELLSAETGDVS